MVSMVYLITFGTSLLSLLAILGASSLSHVIEQLTLLSPARLSCTMHISIHILRTRVGDKVVAHKICRSFGILCLQIHVLQYREAPQLREQFLTITSACAAVSVSNPWYSNYLDGPQCR